MNIKIRFNDTERRSAMRAYDAKDFPIEKFDRDLYKPEGSYRPGLAPYAIIEIDERKIAIASAIMSDMACVKEHNAKSGIGYQIDVNTLGIDSVWFDVNSLMVRITYSFTRPVKWFDGSMVTETRKVYGQMYQLHQSSGDDHLMVSRAIKFETYL